MEDFFSFLGMIALFLGLIFIGGYCLFVVINSYSCAQLGEQIHKPTHFNPWVDCMITIDGQQIPQQNWIYNNGK